MDSGSVASSSAYASGYATIKSGENLIDQSAQTIASQLNSGTESASETQTQSQQKIPSADQVNQALLDLKQGSIYAQAGAKVMQTDFDTTGSLLSVIA